MSRDFIWRDAERTVVLRRQGLAQAARLLRQQGFERFELLSTARALADAPELAAAAVAVHEVAPGGVPAAAAGLVDAINDRRLVALGGGRVIDTAKAVASVRGAEVAAIPTTLSGAEMTAIHRAPAGRESRVAALVRPAFVIADPEAMTSQPDPLLRASAMNALAHGADSLYTPFANPVSRMTALRGAALIAAALDQARDERDRVALAVGSILCGYAIDSALFGLHHVVCQSLVRVCGTPHAETNAAVLPHSAALLAERAPERFGELAEAIGAASAPAALRERIRELGGDPVGLGSLGADRSRLDQALGTMLSRPELAFTPEPPGREELRTLVERAW